MRRLWGHSRRASTTKQATRGKRSQDTRLCESREVGVSLSLALRLNLPSTAPQYLIVQGLIHNTRMALSPVGTQADVDLLQKLYIEPWWLQGLIARDLTVISHKLYDAHK